MPDPYGFPKDSSVSDDSADVTLVVALSAQPTKAAPHNIASMNNQSSFLAISSLIFVLLMIISLDTFQVSPLKGVGLHGDYTQPDPFFP